MDVEFIAPMVVAIVFFLTVAGVVILRPLAKRAADLLELYARDRQTGVVGELGSMRELLETVDARLRLLEERQDFAERLLSESRLDRESGLRMIPDRDGRGERSLQGPSENPAR